MNESLLVHISTILLHYREIWHRAQVLMNDKSYDLPTFCIVVKWCIVLGNFGALCVGILNVLSKPQGLSISPLTVVNPNPSFIQC